MWYCYVTPWGRVLLEKLISNARSRFSASYVVVREAAYIDVPAFLQSLQTWWDNNLKGLRPLTSGSFPNHPTSLRYMTSTVDKESLNR
jgi:hypothetical protein